MIESTETICRFEIKLAQGIGVLAEKTLSNAKSSPKDSNSMKFGSELLQEL